MARVNWDDDIYKLGNWLELVLAVGCQFGARGRLLHAFELTQKFWLEHRGIPERWWLPQHEILIDHGFGERRTNKHGEHVIYMFGAEEKCKFLESKSEAGKKGGASKSPAKTQHLRQNQPKITQNVRSSRNDAEAETNHERNEINRTEASYSFSGSDSYSVSDSLSEPGSDTGTDSRSTPASQVDSNSSGVGGEQLALGGEGVAPDSAKAKRKTVTKGKKADTPELAQLRQETWARYSRSIEERYHTEPPRNAMVNGQIANLVSRLGERAPEVVEFYVKETSDPLYVRKAHQLGLCLQDCESLAVQMGRGHAITRSETISAERKGSVQSTLRKIDQERR